MQRSNAAFVEPNRTASAITSKAAAAKNAEDLRPIFRSTQRNITVGPGDRAVLKCRVENLGTKTVSDLCCLVINVSNLCVV